MQRSFAGCAAIARDPGLPICLETVHVPARLFPQLLDADLTGSFYDVMRRISADSRGRLVERGESVYRHDHYEFRLGVSRAPEARTNTVRARMSEL